VLIFANIASSLPTSVGALLAQNTESDPGNIAIYATAFFLTTLGIIYVQEAERRIPVNYSSRCVWHLHLLVREGDSLQSGSIRVWTIEVAGAGVCAVGWLAQQIMCWATQQGTCLLCCH
jgi:preprotein translocase subunit SecY